MSTEFTPARRGDLVLVSERRSYHSQTEGRVAWNEWFLARVLGVSRDGHWSLAEAFPAEGGEPVRIRATGTPCSLVRKKTYPQVEAVWRYIGGYRFHSHEQAARHIKAALAAHQEGEG